MKRLAFTIIAALCVFSNAFAQNYPLRGYWNTNIVGVGYSYYNESKISPERNFKNSQIDVMGAIYGVYMDASLGFHKYNIAENKQLSSFGADMGYMFPLNPWNVATLTPIRLYIVPMAGITQVKNPHPIDGEGKTVCTHFNYGGALGISVNRTYVQFKYTRTTMGASLAYLF